MGSTNKVCFDIDLNLFPPPEIGTHQDSQPPMAEINSQEECNARLQLEACYGNRRMEIDPERKSMRRFEALLEVVKIVSDDDGSSEPKGPSELMNSGELTTGKKLQGNAEEETESVVGPVEEEEEVSVLAAEAPPSPVVKSKRGRAQELPHKYRDSIVEPLTSLCSRHKGSSSSSTHVPTRRRSR